MPTTPLTIPPSAQDGQCEEAGKVVSATPTWSPSKLRVLRESCSLGNGNLTRNDELPNLGKAEWKPVNDRKAGRVVMPDNRAPIGQCRNNIQHVSRMSSRPEQTMETSSPGSQAGVFFVRAFFRGCLGTGTSSFREVAPSQSWHHHPESGGVPRLVDTSTRKSVVHTAFQPSGASK